ncbi:conserved hypothetical protein [Altererythrobacter sp. B11]|uniref:hypothetical protein n=1 Tax=Altererythrobacter sp. B11 TaxID=2060312 RepID=UPI000DC70B4C|nr:hypothetical protein [Altererythrobacter sp. B11]BBC72931.1 conserved hypothetical protein [Altererythrobacter sp. B11]
MDIDRAKHVGDALALSGGTAGTLAQWSDLAGQLTPILSAGFVLLSILWLMWRMLDRLRFGPSSSRDDG